MQINFPPWELWKKLSKFERGTGVNGYDSLSMTQIGSFCEMYEFMQEDFEKILIIEEIMYPSILERSKTKEQDKREEED